VVREMCGRCVAIVRIQELGLGDERRVCKLGFIATVIGRTRFDGCANSAIGARVAAPNRPNTTNLASLARVIRAAPIHIVRPACIERILCDKGQTTAIRN
jgi:hypothetical protein